MPMNSPFKIIDARQNSIIKKTLIVTGSIVGLVLTAGIIANKVNKDESAESVDFELPTSDA